MEKKQYTITAFTENHIGLLNKITIVFTRRKINIESLTVSESQIKGIHSFTIVVNSTKETVEKVVKQIDKLVEVIKAFYYEEEQLIAQELALYKMPMAAISSPFTPLSAMIFWSDCFAYFHHDSGSCSAQPALTAIIGASFSGKKAEATHLPLSAFTSDAFTEELPTSKPNK